MLLVPLLLLFVSAVSAAAVPRQASNSTNDGIQLAVSPNCGSLSGSPADVNAGLGTLSSFKTIVAFGDSYTDGGVHNGSELLPAVVVPPNPRAGGRITNGPVWAEDLAADAGATLKDYAINGAVIDAAQWSSTSGNADSPSRNASNGTDFVTQLNVFTGQNNGLDPSTTLYTIFFGIGDFVESEITGNNQSSQLASDLLYNIMVLTSSPTFARNILVLDNYGRGTATAVGDAYKQSVFTGLQTLHTKFNINVGFVDFKTIWDGVLNGSPGYASFGYTSPGACTVNDTTTVGECSDPEHTFYWIPGNPSKETHRIMADYVEEVLTRCETT